MGESKVPTEVEFSELSSGTINTAIFDVRQIFFVKATPDLLTFKHQVFTYLSLMSESVRILFSERLSHVSPNTGWRTP